MDVVSLLLPATIQCGASGPAEFVGGFGSQNKQTGVLIRSKEFVIMSVHVLSGDL